MSHLEIVCNCSRRQPMERRSRVASQLLHILLPGRDIPEWFCKQTTGTSISLKLPSNWSRDNFEGFGICVAFDPTYKAFYGRRKNIASVGVEITVRTCTNREYRLHVIPVITGEYKNISVEHVCLVNKSFVDMHDLCDMNDWCEIESRGVYIESYDKDDDDVSSMQTLNSFLLLNLPSSPPPSQLAPLKDRIEVTVE
ncbi:hypothetical protein LguiA_029665 [Lonicera macranthoides]